MRPSTTTPRRPPGALRALLAVTLLAPAALAPAAAWGQESAAEILEEALQRHETRLEGIQDYTVVQETMGFETTTYFEKRTVDGRPVFVVRAEFGEEEGSLENPYAMLPKLAERATLEGTETVQGERCWVLAVSDLRDLTVGADVPSPEGGEFEAREGWFYLDQDEYVMRRMRVEGALTRDGEEHPMTLTATLSDYREVEGLLHPFHTRLQLEGMAAGVSPEDREEARRSLEQLREQMEEMPEAQREMMERMMQGQIEALERMLGDDVMEFEVTVKEVRVNQGPPGG